MIEIKMNTIINKQGYKNEMIEIKLNKIINKQG